MTINNFVENGVDTELLKTFLEVSRTRHFGRAAEALYLTQSVVSFRIRQLENQLGVNLFTRHRNNIRLTAIGEELLPYVEMLVNTWQATRKKVAHSSRHNGFSIGTNASLWECLLNGQLGTLYRDPYNLQFETRIVQRQSLVKQLHERQLDLLIAAESPKMDELSCQLLGNFAPALYYAASGKGKGDLNYLRLKWGSNFQQNGVGLISNDDVPLLTTSSAELAYQQLSTLNDCTWLPISWMQQKSGLRAVTDSVTPSRPLYAI